jgi:hypothetical protein
MSSDGECAGPDRHILNTTFPHSYMAFGPLAVSPMLDHKCVINPYNVYVHSDHWRKEELQEEARRRIHKSMTVMKELVDLLSGRTYSSEREV